MPYEKRTTMCQVCKGTGTVTKKGETRACTAGCANGRVYTMVWVEDKKKGGK